ncbi:MAG: GNAT family N-acetyltransferase [Betaproteobacteria bacterium]
MTDETTVTPRVTCAVMSAALQASARRLLGGFLAADQHYRASAEAYGDGGTDALDRALDLFLARPELGFVWLAEAGGTAVGACVVSFAISTSRGGLAAKLDDVTIDPQWRGKGVGGAMLTALARYLRARGVGRIDSGCHRGNDGAWRFYARQGFRSLDEERIALLL